MLTSSDLFSVYQKAEGLLAEGELRQAADLCKEILDANPDYPYGYHLMASLFQATGTFAQALGFAQMAVKMAPQVATFHMHEGKLLLATDQWQAAGEAFCKAHLLEPVNPEPLLLWAGSVRGEGRFDDALALVTRARALGDTPETDEHEGLCLMMKGDDTLAEARFDRMIARRPDRFEGYVHKGKLLFAQNRLMEAEACFARALKKNPAAHEALHYLSMLSHTQAHPEIAARYAINAIQAQPQYWPGHIWLGALLLMHHKNDVAEYVLQQAHSFQPTNIYLMHLLTLSQRRQGKLFEAVEQVEKLLAQRPDSNMLRYFRTMLKSEIAESAPADYIAGLFDGSADQYEFHLKHVVSCTTAAQVAHAMRGVAGLAKTPWRMLDLGCGTGLAAVVFKEMTGLRIGVDLSERMLEKARAKQLYNELHALDIVEFMTGSDRVFDLVTAVDVLLYRGNLSAFLHAARNVLAPQGILAFTVETLACPSGYRLHANGVFTHDTHYIRNMAHDEGYIIVKQEDVVVRMEHITPIFGSVFLLQKSQMH